MTVSSNAGAIPRMNMAAYAASKAAATSFLKNAWIRAGCLWNQVQRRLSWVYRNTYAMGFMA
ncbi:hypothetical protein BsIDN1_71320 [Bacillus safensis]|uniref:Uncharacterized protein n=1 Tax=Bacillus safensis TaxID=561879 RepID=A0A5S9MMG8_BACIA|nr:hypothetical protein BsIDN1_71320 [Bacillus safensis]